MEKGCIYRLFLDSQNDDSQWVEFFSVTAGITRSSRLAAPLQDLHLEQGRKPAIGPMLNRES